MSHSTISLNTLLNRALINLKRSNELAPEIEAVPKDSAKRQCFALKSTCLGYQQVVNHQAHTLHYAMKGLGYLPLPLLESLVSYLGGPTSKQYLHADAHLRLILAINSKLKTPLELTPMPKLRERFAADAVAMQSPKVWQQTGDTLMNNIKRFRKKGEVSVRWTDKVIANADDGDMTIRCYQPDASTYRK
ncbi:alpha/beta hydrolase, partial [Psychrobacter celer]